jgi:hypothetical protein
MSLAERERPMTRLRTWLGRAIVALILAVPIAYFAIGAIATYRVDDDLATVVPGPVERPVQIARTFEMILAREIEHNDWQPNNPWFYPTALTDDGRNFQLGVLHGLRRGLLEYATRTMRLRQDGSIDPNLQRALNLLQYPPNVWVLDLSQGFGASSRSQYGAALVALRAFESQADNTRYADLRADQLQRFIDAINIDLTSHMLALQDYSSNRNSLFDSSVDDLFYQTKGAAFVYAALAPAIRHDFEPIIAQKHLGDLWKQLETSLRRFAEFKPTLVFSGKPDGLIVPNHLMAQGFYAGRSVQILMQIEEILKT